MSADLLLRVIAPPGGGTAERQAWVEQQALRTYLEQERTAQRVTLYGSAHATHGSLFVHSVLLPRRSIERSAAIKWLSWEGNPFDMPSCGLVFGGGQAPRVEYDEALDSVRHPILRGARRLVFGRSFEAVHQGQSYYELAHEIAHAHGLHWVDERSAWCRLDEHGDVVSLAGVGRAGDAIAVVLDRQLLDLHMAATDTCLFQMFDSTVFPNSFAALGNGASRNFVHERLLAVRYRVDGQAGSYFRGAQVIRPPLDAEQLGARLYRADATPKQYASFITHDFKNGRIDRVSCDPKCLASYFEPESTLPFQTSPVFFRADVLDRYKADPQKYRLESRSIHCRSAWGLQTYDVNDAGQVHTMIKYLGDLPYSEQLYWQSFNEPPKAPISRRSFKTDFEGSFDLEQDGLRDLKSVLRKLADANVPWFKLQDPKLVDQLHYPLTDAHKPWNDTILTLSKCVVEGFRKGYAESEAKKRGVTGQPEWGSLRWTRELLKVLAVDGDRVAEIMNPLTDLQQLRSKVGAHSEGSEAAALKRELIKKHGSPRHHVEALATALLESMQALEEILAKIRS